MKHKVKKGKPATRRRTAAASRKPRVSAGRAGRSQAALSVLMALLHADRWVFEAGELARKAGIAHEEQAFHEIRLSIVKSLNRFQERAYGALNERGVVVTTQE